MMNFAKQRILRMWEKEETQLRYQLPLADTYIDMLTLGYQMIGRMRPLLELAYIEDNPHCTDTDTIDFKELIQWMKSNGWNQMAKEFNSLFKQSRKYIKARQNN